MVQADDTLAAFGLSSVSLVALIGGGGKTTLMAAMARDLVRQGSRVVVTTTTRIRHPHRGVVLVEPDVERLIQRLAELLSKERQVTAAKQDLGEGKLKGFSGDELDRLVRAGVAEVVLAEADGAAGRPLKAHADFEPVIPRATDLVVAVIGLDCIGQPLADATVHRAELLRQLLGLSPAQVVMPATVAAIVLHPRGYLNRVPPGARVAVMLNKADDEQTMAAANACAEALRRGDHQQRIERLIIGALASSRPFVAAV